MYTYYSESTSYLEDTREILVRLKMLEWGLFGLGQSTAGLFLAHHYSKMGLYFGDQKGNTWPHFPLQKSPSLLEKTFDDILMNLTYIVSNGKLENVSLLDLPAFGSKIKNLNKDQKKQPNWPTATNFALLRSNANLSHAFVHYKILLDHWKNHMSTLYKQDQSSCFSKEMEMNQYMNFTSFITEDIKTFLITIAGFFINSQQKMSNHCQKIFIKIGCFEGARPILKIMSQ